MRARQYKVWRDAKPRIHGPTRNLCLLCAWKNSSKNAKNCDGREFHARLAVANRLRLDDGADELPPYKGAWRTLVTIVEDEGVLALFTGCSMNVVRTISGALILVGYDQVKALISSSMLTVKK